MKKIISLADIDVTHSPVVRAEYRHEIAEEYAEQYRLKKNTMPMPVLFLVGKTWLIGDGLHRINAMKMAGLKQHVFEVMEGSRHDCVRYALMSNVGHGIRRTNADKWTCVKLALHEFNGMSDAIIADYCAVANSFVATVRNAMIEAKELEPVDTRTGADGKVRPSNITRTKVEPSKTKENSEKTASEAASAAPSIAVVPGAGEAVLDETGYAVPDRARPVWDRRHEIDPFLDTIESLKADIEKAAASGDILFAEVSFKALIADCANVRGQLLLAKPFATCPNCQGQLPEKCRLCLGKGVVSKFRYDTAPEELKKMRGKHG